ncbi:MAG TPA: GNAT family protein [Burkholderiaceae bacterium]|jgi:diamine N-acetyltransferase|nr:GNAT family protein [Burkholderiaceae bacterium]
MTIASGPKVALRRATPQDIPRAHRWLAASNLTANSMGPPWFAERPVPTLEQFLVRFPRHYFDGSRPFDGRALVLSSAAVDLGILAWRRVDLMRDLVELDLWLAAREYCRQGIAAEALDLICAWLQSNYGVNRFLLRPSRRNVRALRCARRAGFRETDFEPADVLGRLGLDPSPYRDPALLFRILPVAWQLPESRDSELWVFLDSEFSSLEAPVLLSLGAVAAEGQTFYVELEQDRPVAYSAFVEQTVLPLMENMPEPREHAAELFLHWLQQLAHGRAVRLISDSGFDRWAVSELLHAEDPPEAVVWQRAPVAYSELDRLSEELRLRRHHALDDALALRSAVMGEAASKVATDGGRQPEAPRIAAQRE